MFGFGTLIFNTMNRKTATGSIKLKEDAIFSKIYLIQGEKVMLDFDLAILYEIETKVLKQAAKRNEERFPKTSCLS